ncbi:hypothetical protein MTR67_051656 [Solanum verrucosum]|uniref:Uncharacterized protein n=1 Tax=Solanum verrucosum TaxID=315347 RepID=A0AAF0V7W4_SOLVR|nr:hypothetical protein MTR67_051656 [Solanum verrucosum]
MGERNPLAKSHIPGDDTYGPWIERRSVLVNRSSGLKLGFWGIDPRTRTTVRDLTYGPPAGRTVSPSTIRGWCPVLGGVYYHDLNFWNKDPEVLNDVNDLSDGQIGSKDYARDYPSLVRKSSNTREDSINVTSLGHEIENVNSIGDNSAKGKTPIGLIDNTINNVNSDKDISVASRIPTSDKKNVMGDFCIGKPRQSNRSVIPPKRLNDYFRRGRQ